MNEDQTVSDCCGTEVLFCYNGGVLDHTDCTTCSKPCTPVARKAAFDLDRFFAGAKRAGEILDEKEKREEGTFCANPECDGDFPVNGEIASLWLTGDSIVAGGHMHPASTRTLSPSKPSEPKEWEKALESLHTVYIDGWDELVAFISEIERKAEEIGKQSMKDMGNTWEDGYEEGKLLATVSARADERKRILEMVKEHGKQNTYEGEERLVYDTTIQELITRLTSPDE